MWNVSLDDRMGERSVERPADESYNNKAMIAAECDN